MSAIAARTRRDPGPALCVAGIVAVLLLVTATPYTMTKAAFTDDIASAGNMWETGEWAPDVAITAPADGAQVAGQVTLSAQVTGTPAEQVVFTLAGTQICTATDSGGGLWTCTWDSTLVDNGSYAIVASGSSAGSVGHSAPHTITVANAAPVSDGIVWDAAGQKTATGTTATGAVPRPDGVADGDLIVLIVSSWTDAVPTVAGFTSIRTENRSANEPRITAFWRLAGNEPASYTLSLSKADPWHVAVVRVTGHDPVNPIGSHNGTPGRSTSPVAIPGFTTSVDDVLLVAAVVNYGKIASYQPPAGFTQRYSRVDPSPGGGGTYPSTAAATMPFPTAGPTGNPAYAWTAGGGGSQDRLAAIIFEILPGGPPRTPTELVATSGQAGYVPVSWGATPGATSYDLRYRAQGAAIWSGVSGLTTTAHDLMGLAGGTTYEISVRAHNAFGPSAWATPVTATPADPPEPPSAPTDLVASPVGVDQVQLTWTDTADNEVGFTVERSPAGAGSWVVAAVKAADSTGHTDGGLTASTAYDYRVRTYNAAGTSPWTTTGPVTTQGCATLATLTLQASADAAVLEGYGTPLGLQTYLGTRSLANGNGRSLVSFPSIARPGGCAITSATLRLHTHGESAVVRSLQVLRVDAAWEESSVLWTNQPGASGSPVFVPSGPGWRTWDVTQMVGALGTGAPHGFQLRDSVEGSTTQYDNLMSPREGANPPQLVLTFQ